MSSDGTCPGETRVISQSSLASIDHRLGQAAALHRAEQIRAYVAAVREINPTAPQPLTPSALDEWSGWALAQADRIDPVLSGAYKSRPSEPAE
jgi:hypothetical protein